MKVNDQHYHTIWLKDDDNSTVQIIDQRYLPHEFVIEDLKTVDDVAHAIKDMHVRGAPLIGVTAAFGMYFAALEAKGQLHFMKNIHAAAEKLKATRPTAVNLAWAVDYQLNCLGQKNVFDLPTIFLHNAQLFKKDSIE